jgi:hypothetical protein
MKDYIIRARCEDCYFRRAQLCALRLDEPCPTFRPYVNWSLAEKQSPAPRPLGDAVRAQLKAAAA